MLFLILSVVVIIAVIWWLNGERALSRNERLYLKRRGYEPPSEAEAAPPVSKDAHLFSLIESLSDISPSHGNAQRKTSRECAPRGKETRECFPR